MSHRALLPALIAIAIIFRMTIIGFPESTTGMDDANVFFAYAKNVVNGHGVRWHPSQDPVEGFTSPLWLGIVCLGYGIAGSRGLEVFLLLFMSALLSVFLIRLWDYIRAMAGSRPAWMACLLVIFFPGSVEWIVLSMMDTGIWTLAIVALLLPAFLPTSARLLIIACLPLIRPEGFLYSPLFLFLDFMLRRRGNKPLYPVWVSLTGFLLLVVSLTLCRYQYFGIPLPNTFYAKVDTSLIVNLSSGIRYIAMQPIITSALPTMLLGYLYRTSNQPTGIQVLFLYSLVLLGQTALVGGDHFALGRFILPVAICSIVFAAIAAAPLVNAWSNKGAFALGCLFIFSMNINVNGTIKGHHWNHLTNSLLYHEFRIAHEFRGIGYAANKLLAPHYPPVAAIAIGGLGYTYNGWTYDLVGLTYPAMTRNVESQGSRVLGHSSFNADVLFRDRPRYILPRIVVSNADAQSWLTEFLNNSDAFEHRVLQSAIADERLNALYQFRSLGQVDSSYKLYAFVLRQSSSHPNLP